MESKLHTISIRQSTHQDLEAFKRSASVDIIWVIRRGRDSGKQTTWIKQSLPQRNVCVGCQLNSDQALKLLCLKEYVRARDSTLRRYRCQEASEFLCTKIPVLGGSWQTKKIAKKNQKCSFWKMRSEKCVLKNAFRVLKNALIISRLDVAKQKKHTLRGFLKPRFFWNRASRLIMI